MTTTTHWTGQVSVSETGQQRERDSVEDSINSALELEFQIMRDSRGNESGNSVLT